MELSILPSGSLLLRATTEATSREKRVANAFAESLARGLLQLATAELQAELPASLAFCRDVARAYVTRLCRTPERESTARIPAIAPPHEELAEMALQAPPMPGAEYLTVEVLERWWNELDALVREEIGRYPGGTAAYLHELNPLWRLVGRVTFHLAENKRDPEHPFAFLATYASRLSGQGRVQHEPLGRALTQYAGAKNREQLLSLLAPLQRAAERSILVKELVESGEVYQAIAWTPRDAHRFLREVPALEECGLIVRVPDWWNARRPPRPMVSVTVGSRAGSRLDVATLLDFSVEVEPSSAPRFTRSRFESVRCLVKIGPP